MSAVNLARLLPDSSGRLSSGLLKTDVVGLLSPVVRASESDSSQALVPVSESMGIKP